jgi:hypothetical protein
MGTRLRVAMAAAVATAACAGGVPSRAGGAAGAPQLVSVWEKTTITMGPPSDSPCTTRLAFPPDPSAASSTEVGVPATTTLGDTVTSANDPSDVVTAFVASSLTTTTSSTRAGQPQLTLSHDLAWSSSSALGTATTCRQVLMGGGEGQLDVDVPAPAYFVATWSGTTSQTSPLWVLPDDHFPALYGFDVALPEGQLLALPAGDYTFQIGLGHVVDDLATQLTGGTAHEQASVALVPVSVPVTGPRSRASRFVRGAHSRRCAATTASFGWRPRATTPGAQRVVSATFDLPGGTAVTAHARAHQTVTVPVALSSSFVHARLLLRSGQVVNGREYLGSCV